MYNGIGLQTPRGSGTNGYIQTNKFFVKPRPGGTAAAAGIPRPGKDDGVGPGIRKANKEILDHDRKRRIQLRLLVLEETLVDQGFTASEIAERLAEAMEGYKDEAPDAADGAGGGGGDLRDPTDSKRFSDAQTHQVALRKEKQSEIFRDALKITRDQPSESEFQPQKPQVKANDSGSEDTSYEERKGHEKVSKGCPKQLDRDLHVLVDEDREKNPRKKTPAEEPGTDDIQRTKTDIGGKNVDIEKSNLNRQKERRSSEYSDSASEDGRRKGGKAKKEHKKSSQGYSSEVDSDFCGSKKRKYVSRRKKSNRKNDSSSSDSQGDFDGENVNRETKRHAKLHTRQDSDSDFESNSQDEDQARKCKKRQRHDSGGSGSDMKNYELLRRKQGGKQKSSRRHDSESSQTDTDIEMRSRDLKSRRKIQNQQSRGRHHDSEDSHADANGEKKRKGSVFEKHNKNRPRKETQESDSDTDDKKSSKSRISKREKFRGLATEDSSSDSFDCDSSSDSGSSTDYGQDSYGRSQRREHGARKADSKFVKMQQRSVLVDDVSRRSSRRNTLKRDRHINDEDDRTTGKLDSSRMERNERFVTEREVNDVGYVSQEMRGKRVREDDDEFDKLSNLKGSLVLEVSMGRKRQESIKDGSSDHYGKSREDQKKEEYSNPKKIEEKRELKVHPKEGIGSRNFDRNVQGDDVSKRRRLRDHYQHQKIYERNYSDFGCHKPDHYRHREHKHSVDADYDHRNSNIYEHRRKEGHKRSHSNDVDHDQYKRHRSRQQKVERREHDHDSSGQDDRRQGH